MNFDFCEAESDFWPKKNVTFLNFNEKSILCLKTHFKRNLGVKLKNVIFSNVFRYKWSIFEMKRPTLATQYSKPSWRLTGISEIRSDVEFGAYVYVLEKKVFFIFL